MLSLWEDAGTGARVVRLTESDEIETLVRLFETVAAAENWQPGDALRLSSGHSAYFAVELEGQIAGGLQLNLPHPTRELRCRTLWPEVTLAPPLLHRAHVSVLALAPAVRGRSSLFWNLVVEMWRFCVGEGIATLYLEVTPRVLPLYRRLGWPLVVQGDKKVHWGEECYLCTLGIAEVAQALLQRSEHSPYYRQIVAQAFRVTRPVVKSPKTVSATSVGESVATYIV